MLTTNKLASETIQRSAPKEQTRAFPLGQTLWRLQPECFGSLAGRRVNVRVTTEESSKPNSLFVSGEDRKRQGRFIRSTDCIICSTVQCYRIIVTTSLSAGTWSRLTL